MQAHLDLLLVRKETCSCEKTVATKKLLRSHVAGTLGSHPVRNETCSCDKTAAFSSRTHAWLSLAASTLGSHSVPTRHAHASTLGSSFGAQKDMFL